MDELQESQAPPFQRVFDMDPNVIGPKSEKQWQFMHSEAVITVFGGAAGAGKALRNGTPVLTKDGWVPIEAVHFGDVIPTPHNGMQLVTGVHPQGVVDIYKVTLQDGTYVDVCGNHLWKIRRAGDGLKRTPRVVNTIELKEILNFESKKIGRKRWPIIDLCGEAVLPEQDTLPMHPYLLGCLLGDGGMTTSNTSFTCADQETIDKLSKLTDVRKFKGQYQYSIPGLLDVTRMLDVRHRSDFKVIPEIYMTGSIEERYQLIQGLMDTDGTVDKESRVSFCSTSEVMANQLATLIRSVGGTATITTKNPICHKPDGSKVAGKLAHILHVRHPDAKKLFSLQRKKDRCKGKVIGNRVLSVEFVDKDYATCISISGQDKQFITKDYIVTHNSYNGAMAFLKFIHLPNFRGLITRRTTPQLKGPGGIHDTCTALFTLADPKVRWKDKDGKFVFSSGAEVFLRHFEDLKSKDNFQG